jgi:hypothetical protein
MNERISKDYKNISVRLDTNDYDKLESITEYFNNNSYFKGSYADTLRIAINKLYDSIQAEKIPTEKTVKESKVKNTNRTAKVKEETKVPENTKEEELTPIAE